MMRRTVVGERVALGREWRALRGLLAVSFLVAWRQWRRERRARLTRRQRAQAGALRSLRYLAAGCSVRLVGASWPAVAFGDVLGGDGRRDAARWRIGRAAGARRELPAGVVVFLSGLGVES